MVIFKAKKKIGMSPGSLVYVGERTDEPVKISIMDYNADRLDEFPEAGFKEKKEVGPQEESPVLASESGKAEG